MIELVILSHLQDRLEVPVSLETPESPPSRFVSFEKVGSGSENRLPSSTFAFQSHAESLYETVKLNNLVKSAVQELEAHPEIAGVRLNSDYNFPDLVYKRHRYQAVYNIQHY